MANPTVLDWIDENKFRAFPVKENSQKVSSLSTSLTNDVLLDANLVLSSIQSSCNLTSILVTNDTAIFTITTGQVFTATKANPFPQYLRNAAGSLLVVGEGVLAFPNGTHTFSTVTFESSVVTEFTAEWLGVEELIINTIPLVGDITLREGYQVEISSSKNSITIGADNLFGSVIGCDIPEEAVSDCDAIVSFVNGVGPEGNNRLFITAGKSIVVWDDPENHRIYVGYAFTSIDDVCKDIPPFPII